MTEWHPPELTVEQRLADLVTRLTELERLVALLVNGGLEQDLEPPFETVRTR